MKAYLTELLGTFFLVLAIGLSVTAGAPLAALAIGATLMVMVYMGGHVSGAHYNPAVTFAVWLRGKLPAAQVAPYVIAQLTGAFAAAATVGYLTGQHPAPEPAASMTLLGATIVETLFTFALVLVVLNVATSPKTEGNQFYGLAIGLTVFAGAVAAGPLSGGAFNPAVGLGLVLTRRFTAGNPAGYVWIYLAGPLAGAALAALVYRIQNPEPIAGVKAGDFSVPLPGEARAAERRR